MVNLIQIIKYFRNTDLVNCSQLNLKCKGLNMLFLKILLSVHKFLNWKIFTHSHRHTYKHTHTCKHTPLYMHKYTLMYTFTLGHIHTKLDRHSCKWLHINVFTNAYIYLNLHTQIGIGDTPGCKCYHTRTLALGNM